MEFSEFAQYLQKLESISSRLEMTAVLAELLQKLAPAEIAEASYLLQGQLRPSYASVEFQIAIKTVMKALAVVQKNANDSAENDAEKSVTQMYKEVGDLGLVTEKILQKSAAERGEDGAKNSANQPENSHPTIPDVYQKLFNLAKDSGADSQQRKLDTLVELLKILDPISGKFVVRIILGRLRLGFSDMTMIDALSWAMTGTKSESSLLEDAYQKKADIGQLAEFYLQQKDATLRGQALENYHVQVGIPVIPALCQRLNSAAEMIDKMHDVIAEPKYDGLRVQIHIDKKAARTALPGGTRSPGRPNPADSPHLLRTFTRNLEETTNMFPELEKAVALVNCDSCILDAEAIGYDATTGELLPFQVTVQRKRKHDIAEKAKDVPIRFYVFDLLAINGEDLIHKPLLTRKEKLAKLFPENNSILYHSIGLRTQDPVELHNYHNKNLAEGLEGVVVKQVDSFYQSGRKGWSWVKMKEAEGTSGKLADTLDVLVMGYYLGRGKRNEFGIGACLVGILDENTNQIKTIAKVGTGLTDEVLRETKKRCDALAVTTQPTEYVVDKMLAPDVWCQPGLVIEVAADELTTSPLHSAGVALRFPRLVKFRDDKNWQQITTMQELPGLAH